MGGLLFVLGMSLLLFGLFAFAFNQPNQTLNVVYCVCWAVLYGLYLIYDTQLIAGNKRFALSLDDYIIGALIIYIDIIGMFLKLLQLLGRR